VNYRACCSICRGGQRAGEISYQTGNFAIFGQPTSNYHLTCFGHTVVNHVGMHFRGRFAGNKNNRLLRNLSFPSIVDP
jgi:hypothetical protein